MKPNWDSNSARVASSLVNTLGDSSKGGRGSDPSSSAKGTYIAGEEGEWEQLHLSTTSNTPYMHIRVNHHTYLLAVHTLYLTSPTNFNFNDFLCLCLHQPNTSIYQTPNIPPIEPHLLGPTHLSLPTPHPRPQWTQRTRPVSHHRAPHHCHAKPLQETSHHAHLKVYTKQRGWETHRGRADKTMTY